MRFRRALLTTTDRARRALGICVAIALAATGCSSGGDPGDLNVFCNLLGDGVGLSETDANPVEFEALEQVAPPEIRPTITNLRLAALELDEVPDDDLEGLFAARFNPQAAGARSELESYAGASCGIDFSGGAPVGFEELTAEIENYLAVSAAGRPWLDQIRIDPATVAGQLHSVRVAFLVQPADPVYADEVCTNVSGYVYGQRAAIGSVTVDYDGAALSQRNGPDGICARP